MKKTVLKNIKWQGTVTDFTLENGRIAAIGSYESEADALICDCTGLTVYPGLFDIHTHGCDGVDVMDADLAPICRFWAKNGTTMFLPTTMTESYERILAALQAEQPKSGAKIPGFHLEGPYLNSDALGAQNGNYVRPATMEEFSQFPHAKLITVAPEVEGNIEFIRHCGIKVALGHTKADYDMAKAAMDAGASCLTHTCNAMPAFLHRAPGPIGAALTEGAYVQVICDGIHLHRAMVLGLYKMFGAEKMILISDSMRATGLPDGKYELGGQEIHVQDSVARTDTGALAGSTSSLFRCVKTAVSFGIPAEDAVRMASRTPAEFMGMDYGKIEIGSVADLILVDDSFDLQKVLIDGVLVD